MWDIPYWIGRFHIGLGDSLQLKGRNLIYKIRILNTIIYDRHFYPNRQFLYDSIT